MTNREEYLKRHKLSGSQSIQDISRTSKIPKKTLQEVYDRGVGAHKTNPSSVRNVKGVKGGPGKKLSKEQWAMARVYSFVNKLEGRRKLNHDLDLAQKVKK
jgi:hypothetical protein